MYAVFALKSLKRHAPVHRSNTFLSPGIARKWRKIHAFRPKWKEMYGMMGNLVADRRRREGPTVMTTGRALSHNFRQHDEEELKKLGARTQYLNMSKVEMTDRVCSSYRKTAKWFTSRNVRLTAPHLGELPESPGCQITCGIVWNRIVTYGIV